MALDPTTLRSRRALLSAAVAATAVTVVEAVARPLPVSAADGENFVLGVQNTATAQTNLVNLFSDDTVLSVWSSGAAGHGGGTALSGFSETGTGSQGESITGIGVQAASTVGKALDVKGKAHFSRSGIATVTAGHKSVTVTVPGGLAGTPLCFANLRSYRSGVAVAAVRSNWPSAGKMRIYLTRTVSSATSVAWMIMD